MRYKTLLGCTDEVAEAIEYGVGRGWVVKGHTGSGHIKMVHPKGGCVIMSTSPNRTSHIKRKIIGDIHREEKKWNH